MAERHLRPAVGFLRSHNAVRLVLAASRSGEKRWVRPALRGTGTGPVQGAATLSRTAPTCSRCRDAGPKALSQIFRIKRNFKEERIATAYPIDLILISALVRSVPTDENAVCTQWWRCPGAIAPTPEAALRCNLDGGTCAEHGRDLSRRPVAPQQFPAGRLEPASRVRPGEHSSSGRPSPGNQDPGLVLTRSQAAAHLKALRRGPAEVQPCPFLSRWLSASCPWIRRSTAKPADRRPAIRRGLGGYVNSELSSRVGEPPGM